MANTLVSKLKTHLPTRESIAANRWTRPFANHLLRPDLWRFNRRSVPRGVAVGLFIAPVVPIAHTVIAALLAVPTRSNIVVAASITWLINPFTIPPFYIAAYYIGNKLLRLDAMSPVPQITHQATSRMTHWAMWLVDKSGPLALGTLVLATVIAAVGYLFASFGWKLWIARKWRRRLGRRD